MELNNTPPKGTADWLPAEFAVRKYIFDTWRRVCLQFGYQEYLTPIVELADVYRAKSGEDVGGKELMIMTDRGGRELAIRPEMTPSVTRMVSRIYESTPKPIRLFSIANFLRNENPQKGRNREFWQLNADIFGSESTLADVEVLQLAIEIMKAFGANADQFIVYVNDRRLVEKFLTQYLQVPADRVEAAIRILDKFGKLSSADLQSRLTVEAGAQIQNPEEFMRFMQGDDATRNELTTKLFKDDPDFIAFNQQIAEPLEGLGYRDFIFLNYAMVRGLDYYDGMVFEVYDREHFQQLQGQSDSSETYRSLFGGGRYNGLAAIFGGKSFPAVGFAPGDETTKLFLEKYSLVPAPDLAQAGWYVPLIDSSLQLETMQLVSRLRLAGENVIQGLEEQKVGKALEYANKQGFAKVVLLGTEEKAQNIYKIKDMRSGEETTASLSVS